jgi:hypothetical protein
MPFIKASHDFKTRLAPWGVPELSKKFDGFVSPSTIRNHIEDGTVPPEGVIRKQKPGSTRMIYKITNLAAIEYGIKIGALPPSRSTEEKSFDA